MATAAGRNRCVACGKEKATFKCGGCLREFCFNHLGQHKQELSKQLDELEVNHDLFRQTLTEQTARSQKHPLIQQIDQWERDSINKIQQTAEDARQILLGHTTLRIRQVEVKLNKLTDQLRESRQENDFFETDLLHWDEELTRLKEEITKPVNITIRQESTALVSKIYVSVPVLLQIPNIGVNARWMQNAVTVAGGNGRGDRFNQLHCPFGMYVDDDDQSIYVADYSNHRIVEWKYGATNGRIIAGGNGQGNRSDQLNHPTDVIVDKEKDSIIICDSTNRRVVSWLRRNATSGQMIIPDVHCYGLKMDNDRYLHVSDINKHQVKLLREGDNCKTEGVIGNGHGNRFDQLSYPSYIFVDQDHSVYVSDSNNHRVIKWKKSSQEGIVVAGGQGQGNTKRRLSNPYGVIVDQLGTIYVADYSNHRVMRWPSGAAQGSIVVGGNGRGGQANQLHGPVGLSFDRQGNLYVVDMDNHRVQRFNIDLSSNS